MTSVEPSVPTTKATTTSAAPDFSKALAALGPPPLLQGENAADYDALLAAISDAVNPIDIFEHYWVRDVVYFIWLLHRYRRYMTDLLETTKQKAHRDCIGAAPPQRRSTVRIQRNDDDCGPSTGLEVCLETARCSRARRETLGVGGDDLGDRASRSSCVAT